MRSLYGLFLLAIVAYGAAAYKYRVTRASQQEQPQTAPKPQPSVTPSRPVNPNQEINNRFVKQFSERVAGRENEPAGRVFKNIQLDWFKSVPAGRFLGIMNGGYARALGVSCTHCHVEQDFASDDQRPKRAAREMASMHRMINERLDKMQNLTQRPQDRPINCVTCHRGAISPTQ
jgi:hypothetical protein